MNLVCMDVSKSFWSVQCKKSQLDFLFFFLTENFAGAAILNITLSECHNTRGCPQKTMLGVFGIAKYYSLPSGLAIDGLSDVTQ